MISGRHDHKECQDEGAQKLEQWRHTLNWSYMILDFWYVVDRSLRRIYARLCS
jgi:hypothetical protein